MNHASVASRVKATPSAFRRPLLLTHSAVDDVRFLLSTPFDFRRRRFPLFVAF